MLDKRDVENEEGGSIERGVAGLGQGEWTSRKVGWNGQVEWKGGRGTVAVVELNDV